MKKIHVIKAMAIAFARYSKIPMPIFVWEEADFGASLVCFPWVGAVIGAVALGLYYGAAFCQLPVFATACLLASVPLWLTGGFHVDGFLDTADARASYKSREEKLSILHDSRIGAFAVIGFVRIGLVYFGSLSVLCEAHNASGMWVWAAGFFVARVLCALCVSFLPPARKTGMLYEEAGSTKPHETGIRTVLVIELFLSFSLCLLLCEAAGVALIVSAILSLLYFVVVCQKEFGGITGDLAGYFVVLCEANMTLGMALLSLLERMVA